MARPRKVDTTLPPRVHFRHGRHWYVYRGKWNALACDRQEAIEQARKLNLRVIERPAGRHAQLKIALEKVFLSRRNNARARGLDFTITLAEIVASAKNAKWRCAVTGLQFSLERPAERRQPPFAPSIDRIDSAEGYVPGNVRVVCLAANFAMNEWGDGVMQKLAEGWIKAEFRRRNWTRPRYLEKRI